VLAGAVDSQPATVRLTAPPPLDTHFEVVDADGWRMVVGPDSPVGRVRRWDMPAGLDPLPLVDAEHIEQGHAWWEHVVGTHAFPTCFGCGHERPPGDGLFLCPSSVEGSEYKADTWTPRESETGDSWVWAAVDSPSGWGTMAVGEKSPVLAPMLLGELSLSISKNPEAGVEYQVVARPAGQDGRKLRSDVALVAPDGENIARFRSTWIRLAEVPS
jgi:hypothetical protein